MALHRIFTDGPITPAPSEITISGDEARHAVRVKRLETGDPVELLDGRGTIASCSLAGSEKRGQEWGIRLRVLAVRQAPQTRPRVDVVSAAPKGPRLAEMIDQLSQVGAALWAPLDSARSVVEPGAAKLDRLGRVAAEAAKQCGRAWRLEIGPRIDFATAIAGPDAIVADASGKPYQATGSDTIRLIVGPEGGWDQNELAAARAAGRRVARFGPHTMRIETAVIAAVAVILGTEADRLPGNSSAAS